jgi:Fe/S biogenesis protein NfuA
MITFTDKARERILAFIEQEESAVALRLTVQPGSPLAPHYELTLVDELDEQPGDTVVDAGGFKLYVDEASAGRLEGATVDWVESMDGGGFNVDNPNVKPIGSEAPTGELAQRVAQLIDTQVNPAVASHGGRVSLVDVRDNVVFVELSGGCQGCGMARVTLQQGIERLIKEMIPEVGEVIDVTDHSMGRDPYYRAPQ